MQDPESNDKAHTDQTLRNRQLCHRGTFNLAKNNSLCYADQRPNLITVSSDCETILGYFYHANFICGGIKHGYKTIEKETEKATSSKGKTVIKDVKREVEKALKNI